MDPTGQSGDTESGRMKVMVWIMPPWQEGLVVQEIATDEAMGTFRAATMPSIRIVLELEKPKPLIEISAPIGPFAGEIEYSFAATVEEPQSGCVFAMAARVNGPTKPVPGTE